MQPTRMSIRMMMAVIGLAAVSLAVGRRLYANDIETLCGSLLIGLCLQVGVVRLCRGAGGRRAFWAGFVGAGALAFSSFLVADWEGMSDSWCYRVWRDYCDLAEGFLRFLPGGGSLLQEPVRSGNPVTFSTAAIVLFLPQLFIALAGGVVVRRLYTIASSRSNAQPARRVKMVVDLVS